MEPKKLFFCGSITLPETNSEFTPENGWLEYILVSFLEFAYFQVRTVSFRECIYGCFQK